MTVLVFDVQGSRFDDTPVRQFGSSAVPLNSRPAEPANARSAAATPVYTEAG